MRCRLLALDLDGTVLDDRRRLPEEVARAVVAAGRRGIEVVLCSGRMVCSVAPYWRRLGLGTPIVGCNGACARQPVTAEEVFFEPVPLALTLEVVRLARRRGLHVQTYVGDELWVAERNDYVRRYERTYGVRARVVGDLEQALRQPSTKVLLVVEPGEVNRVYAELRERYRGRLFVTQSEDIHVELLHHRANKAAALKAVAGRLGLGREDTVAVGDGINDIEMVRWAGVGVAVGWGKAELQAVAEVVLGEGAEGAAEPHRWEALVRFLDGLEPSPAGETSEGGDFLDRGGGEG